MGGKKIMGLPLAVWLGVAAGGLLLGIYLRRKGSTSTAIAPATSFPLSDPNAGLSSSLDSGIAGGGLSPASGAGVDPATIGFDPSVVNDLLTNEGAVAAQLGSLTDAIGSLIYNVPSSGGSGASGTGKDPYATATPDMPKGAATLPTATKPKAPAIPKAVAKAPAPIHYYTFKKDVPLIGGKTLHFTSGKGYYAA